MPDGLNELSQWLAVGTVFAALVGGAVRIEMRVNRCEERLERGDRRLGELADRDDSVLRALNELRVAVARLEEKIDRRNGT